MNFRLFFCVCCLAGIACCRARPKRTCKEIDRGKLVKFQNHMDIPLETLNTFLRETLACAEESGVTSDLNSFLTFVREFIPPEYLDFLENETNASLEDIWNENYYVVEDNDVEDGCCLICEREMNLTRHHLIPRETHKQMAKKLGLEADQLNRTISICRMCHSTVHRFYTNKELASNHYTLELIMAEEKMQKYAKWASSQVSRGNRRTR